MTARTMQITKNEIEQRKNLVNLKDTLSNSNYPPQEVEKSVKAAMSINRCRYITSAKILLFCLLRCSFLFWYFVMVD